MIDITYEDIIRNLRTEISTQTGLNINRIINAVSSRGPDLLKLISNSEATSFNLADCFIVFELLESDSGENVVIHDKGDVLSSISPFNFTLKIYGNACHKVAQDILMRFKSEKVVTSLYKKGIFIHGITFPSSINEFINNTVWPRCDMSIHIIVEFRTEETEKTYDAEGISGIVVKTIEEAEADN